MKNKKFYGAKQFYSYFKKDKIKNLSFFTSFGVLGILDALPMLVLSSIIDILSGASANILGISIPIGFNVSILLSILFFLWIIVEIGEQQIRANIRIKAAKYINVLRKDLHKSVLVKTQNFLPKVSRGDLVNRINNDIYSVHSIYTTPSCELISPIVKAIFSLIYLSFLDYRLGLLVIISIPFFIYISNKMMEYDFKETHEVKKGQAKVSNYFINMLSNFKMILLNNGEKKEENYFENLNNEVSKKEINLTQKYKLFWFLMNVLKIAVCIIAFLITVQSINSLLYSAGTLLLVYNYVKNTYQPTFATTRILSAAITGSVEMERVFSIIENKDYPPYVSGPKHNKIEEIEFKDILVEIGNKKINYKQIFFNKNKLNFVVGKSGCGKSILTTLLFSNFFKKSGKFLVNGIESDTLNIEDVSYCLQDSSMLNRSINENLQYSNKVFNKKLINVLNIGQDILSKPTELLQDSQVDNLSGGEKRKISLYRSLNKKAKVYVLDEPTNDLDNSTKTNLINYLKTLKNKSIIIIITHDKSIIPKDENVINI